MTHGQHNANHYLSESQDANHASFDENLADSGKLPVQDPKFADVARRLIRKYGEGDKPRLRLLLFERIQREACAYGLPVMRIINGAARSAETARDPARYFCSTVSRRLKEAGFLQTESEVW